MSGSLLDTNIPSETLKLVPEAKVANWLTTCRKEEQFLSVISVGELRRGATLLAPGARRAQLEDYLHYAIPLWFGSRILPVTQVIANRWGILDAQRQIVGRPLNIADGLIAATALEHDLTLVTRNTKDFVGLGLTLINPWDM